MMENIKKEFFTENEPTTTTTQPNKKPLTNNKNINNNYDKFLIIWRNITIKNEILYHLRIYNIHSNTIFEIGEISIYKYGSYLERIKIEMNEFYIRKEVQTIPYGIKEIEIICYSVEQLSIFVENPIPSSVHTVKFKGLKCINDFSFLPSSVETIQFCNNHNQPFKVGDLPSTITSIEFGNSFNQSLQGDWLPSAIKSIRFGDCFIQPIEEFYQFLPKSLTALILPNWYRDENLQQQFNFTPSFNENQEFSIPPLISFRTRFSDRNFSLNSNSIPKAVTILKFTYRFSQTIEANRIPCSVKTIVFGHCFDSKIKENSLPINLSTIKFGSNFNQSFDFSSLVNLSTLIFGDKFNQPLEDCKFPPNLKYLTFGKQFKNPIPSGYFLEIPLENLDFNCNTPTIVDDKTLPSTLISLDLGYSRDLRCCKSLNQLKSLTYWPNKNIEMEYGGLSNSLKEIKLNEYYSGEIEEGTIPNNIESMSFGFHFKSPIQPNVLPNSLTTLTFGYGFNQPIEINVLPNNLKTLTFGGYFNQPIEINVLPNSLTSLTFTGLFNQRIDVETLPNSITFLSFGDHYQQNFPISSLPSSLKELEIHSKYFNQDLSSSFNDLFTTSLKTIFINKISNLVNLFDSNFFIKYIKYLKE
ncbi:hypothetical protein ACTA71_010385 [Dictyostelium dimigraforme]